MSSSSSLDSALARPVKAAVSEAFAASEPPPPAWILDSRAALSVHETADALGVSAAQVRRWIDAGELVPVDFSGARRLIGTDQLRAKLAAAESRRRNVGEAP